MSVGYSTVQWNRAKRTYDIVAAAGIGAYLLIFVTVSSLINSGDSAISPPILIIRAAGSCAIVLLHIILCIGPLARFSPRFSPLLYNRRHLGVMTFLVATIHAAIVLGFYHGFGDVNPFISLLGINPNFLSLQAFPFELPGLIAFIILFLLAATSHDFWLKNLSASTWKRLHMSVYVAYGLLIAHVAFGALQTSRGLVAPALMLAGCGIITTLHLAAALRERKRDVAAPSATDPAWLDAGPADAIPTTRARVVCAQGGERIAVFRDGNLINAVTNVCAHQGGPLGEGKIVDGCITCPWHGWQYRAGDGCSPPPFAEKITTYRVRIVKGRVEVDPNGLPPGTPIAPALIDESSNG